MISQFNCCFEDVLEPSDTDELKEADLIWSSSSSNRLRSWLSKTPIAGS